MATQDRPAGDITKEQKVKPKIPYFKQRKSQTAVEIVRDARDRALKYRSRFEEWWTDSYMAYISKNTKPVAGFSDFFLSLSYSQVRTVAPQLWLNHVSEPPYAYFYPTDKRDSERARLSEAVVAALQEEGEMPTELLFVLYMMLIYGDAWMKHTYAVERRKFAIPQPILEAGQIADWDFSRTIEQEMTTFDGIRFEARSPWRLLIDPAAYDPRPSRITYLIDGDPMVPLERLYDLQAQGALYNVDKIDPDGWIDPWQRSLQIGGDRERPQAGDMKDMVFIEEMWTSQNERMVVANGNLELFRGRHPLLAGMPYTHFGMHNLPLEVFNYGVPKQLEYVQNLLNAYASLSIDEQSLRVYTPVIMGPSVAFRSGFNRLTPGIVIHGHPDDIQYLERPNHQSELFNAMDRFDIYGQRTTGINLAAEGIESGGNTTATSSAIASAGAKGFVNFLTHLVGVAIGRMSLHNNMTAVQFMTSRNMRMLSSDLQPVFNFVRRQDLATSLHAKIKDKSQAASNLEEMNILISLLDRMMPFFADQIQAGENGASVIPGMLDAREVWLDIFKTAKLQNYPRYFKEGMDVSPQAQQIAQLINQMRGAGGMGTPGGGAPPGGQFGNALGQLSTSAAPRSNLGPGQLGHEELIGF